MDLRAHYHHSQPFEQELPGEREGRLVGENRQLRELVGELRRENCQLRSDLEHVNRSLDHVMSESGHKRKHK